MRQAPICPACGARICGDRLAFDFEHRCVVGPNRAIALPFIENEILKYLHNQAPHPVTGTALDWQIYRSLDVNAPGVMRVHICNLRKKLEPLGIDIRCQSGGRAGRDETLYWLTW